MWRPLDISWRSVIDGVEDSEGPIAALKTSPLPYGYGALSSPINISSLTTIKVRARALAGKVGFCLVEPDNGPLVSAQHHITPDMGDISVMITANPEHPNVELVVRNFDDPGVVGEVLVQSVEILDHVA